MSSQWNTTTISTSHELRALLAERQQRGWLFRGQSKSYDSLVPSIDRRRLSEFDRREKLSLELRSIASFRAQLGEPASQLEAYALVDAHMALTVMRHFDVPTRLLDWTLDPDVATYFAVRHHEGDDGEVWAFSELHYRELGAKQWERWPQVLDARGDFHPQNSMFWPTLGDVDWVVCSFYHAPIFPRQMAQKGAFSMTANFRRDHSEYLAQLLRDKTLFHRFVLPSRLKLGILDTLEQGGTRDEALYPSDLRLESAARIAAVEFVRPE